MDPGTVGEAIQASIASSRRSEAPKPCRKASQNTMGISSADLARNIPGSVYCSTLDKVTAQLRELARPGDLILTVGAGDIYRAGEKLLSETEG